MKSIKPSPWWRALTRPSSLAFFGATLIFFRSDGDPFAFLAITILGAAMFVCFAIERLELAVRNMRWVVRPETHEERRARILNHPFTDKGKEHANGS